MSIESLISVDGSAGLTKIRDLAGGCPVNAGIHGTSTRQITIPFAIIDGMLRNMV